MDTKTKERVIAILLKHKKDGNFLEYYVSDIYQILFDELPDLDTDVICACVEALKEEGFLEEEAFNSKTKILPKAIGYVRKLEEERQQDKDKKWEDRRWSLLQVGIGTLLGIVGTMLIQYLLKKLL